MIGSLVTENVKNKYSWKALQDLHGMVGEKEAGVSLVDFAQINVGWTVELLFGLKLFPYQSYILTNWFEKNYCMNFWSRGASKSYLGSIFGILYPVLNLESRIVFASNTFRSSKRLFEQGEKFVASKEGYFLSQCYTEPASHRNEAYTWNIGGGTIKALPLNEHIRGERADILIIDEFLLIPEELYKGVLMPFLNAKKNIQERIKLKEIRDSISDSDKHLIGEEFELPDDKKIICLTSAPWEFQYANTLYQEWKKIIQEPSNPRRHKYFTSRLSYKSLPEELVEADVVEMAKAGGENSPYFQREYLAMVPNSSSGFFNIQKMHENTVSDGNYPCVRLKGDPECEYILGLDPNMSASKTSDYFAFALLEINKASRSVTLVHSYSVAGRELRDYFNYLHYLVKNFNITLIMADLPGDDKSNNFIESANQSEIFKSSGINLKFIDGNFDKDDYVENLYLGRNSVNMLGKRICYRQFFSPVWIRKSNENLQLFIQDGKLKFASALQRNPDYDKYRKIKDAPLEAYDRVDKQMSMVEYIDFLDGLLNETKNQIGLIEQQISSTGNFAYDLPSYMKRNRSNEDRPRRDSYTAVLMATWGAKIYFDMFFELPAEDDTVFEPFFL